MDARQARKLVRRALIQQKLEAERKETEAQKKEREDHEKLMSEVTTFYIPNVLKHIKSEALKGKMELRYEVDSNSKFQSRLKEELESLGYKVSLNNRWVDAERGDPDSGEGRCDAHREYWLDVSWG